jgi:hypothetical protein
VPWRSAVGNAERVREITNSMCDKDFDLREVDAAA